MGNSKELFSNDYFKDLLSHDFVQDGDRYKATGPHALYMLKTDVLFKWDAELLAIVQEFASDNAAFLSEFASGWTQVANADRFDGPTGNICTMPAAQPEVAVPSLQASLQSSPADVDANPASHPTSWLLAALACVGLVAAFAGVVLMRRKRAAAEDSESGYKPILV